MVLCGYRSTSRLCLIYSSQTVCQGLQSIQTLMFLSSDVMYFHVEPIFIHSMVLSVPLQNEYFLLIYYYGCEILSGLEENTPRTFSSVLDVPKFLLGSYIGYTLQRVLKKKCLCWVGGGGVLSF